MKDTAASIYVTKFRNNSSEGFELVVSFTASYCGEMGGLDYETESLWRLFRIVSSIVQLERIVQFIEYAELGP